MQKLSAQSKDLSQENIKKIQEIFPNCVTEAEDDDGKLVRKIDFDILRQDLSDHVVDGPKERYQFNWPGKREAILLANAPTTNTLRPLPEKSVDFENTKNVYIEGDNLEALKILRETYMGKIKMIYIDPPYNTGNDFVYKDNFKNTAEEYLKSSGGIDEEGNRMEVNGEFNGRFHSDWLNMMYPRLILARDLLSDDGVIYISIDDNEQKNLKSLCEDIFGQENFVAQVIWERAFSPKNDARYFSSSHDYILIFAKNITSFVIGKLPRTEEMNSRFKNPDNDPNGPWSSGDLTAKTYSAAYDYPIVTPSGKSVSPTSGRSWITSKENMAKWISEGRIWFGQDGNGTPRYKRYLSEMTDGIVPVTLWKYDDVGHSQEGRQEVKDLFDGKGLFDGPKPIRLMNRIIQTANVKKDDIFLDFFSGSASTAHAALQTNLENNSACRYIMVQVPEPCEEGSAAYKAGYKTICEIGEERIRRAGKKIKDKNPLIAQSLDTGFRVYKIDSSNMKDYFFTPQETQMSVFENAESAIKPDRNSLDLVTQVMLQLGIALDAAIVKGNCSNGAEYYSINGNDLICCFDKNIVESDIEELAKMQPINVAFRDDSFKNDEDSVNCEQIFKTLSPITGKNIFVL